MGICVNVTREDGERAPRNVVIEGNRIHDCGELPATNHHHGIYIAKAVGTVVRGNWIYSNADRGVQLYPNADESIVTRNVIDGNGQGVIFGGGESSSSDNNLVARNVITHSNLRYNVQSHWQGPTGVGNVARENCVYGGARPRTAGSRSRTTGSWLAGTGGGTPASSPRRATSDCRRRACADRPWARPGRARRVVTGLPVQRRRPHHRPGQRRSAQRESGQGPDRGRGRQRPHPLGPGRDVVRCGPGKDRAKVDRRDRVRGCERVRRPD